MKNILNAIKSVFRGFDNKLNQIEKSIPDKLSDLENDLFYSNITEQLHLILSDLTEHDDGTGMFTYEYSSEHGFGYLEDPSKFKIILSFSCNGTSYSYTQDDLNYHKSENGNYILDNYCYVEFITSDKLINVYTAYNNKLESFDLRIYSVEEKVIPSNIVEKMSGASSTEDGKAGIVPAPKAGQQDFALFGDGKYRAFSAQADYTQNDETASDYIKNRPFGYYTIQDIMLEEIPFTYKNTKQQTSLRLIDSELLKLKSSIDVLTVIDGAFGERYDLPKRTIPEYTIDEYSCIGFGNVSLASSSSPDTGEKFLIGISGGDYVYVYRVVDESRVGTESSLTCLVSKPVGKKVDPDFLPMANSSKLGCGKVTVIDDSDTATKRNTKPIYIDSDGILYSGLTLPAEGKEGDIPVIKSNYGNQYEYGRTTLGGFLDGVSSTNYYHQVLLNNSIRDIVFIVGNPVQDLCLSVEATGTPKTIDIGLVGNNCVIHVQSIIKGYISVKIYDGLTEKEYNFIPYTYNSIYTYKLKLYSSGQKSFTCTTYYNKIV